MKVAILIPFRDKHNHKVVYVPGEVKEFDNDRVAALAARGLVEPLECAPEKTVHNENAEVKVKPAKGKDKSKKSIKKTKDTVEEVASDAENVNSDTEPEAEFSTDVDAEMSNNDE